MTDKTAAVHTALGNMDHADAEQWDAEGRPLLAVVRQLAGDDSITEADFDDAAKEYRRDGTVATQPTDADERTEAVDAAGEPVETKSPEEQEAEAKAAAEEAAKLTPRIEALQGKASELKTEIAALQAVRDKALTKAAKHNPQREQSEAIQQYFRTQDRVAHEAHEMRVKVAAALGPHAPKTFASPLDAELGKKKQHGQGRKPHPQLGATGGKDNTARA